MNNVQELSWKFYGMTTSYLDLNSCDQGQSICRAMVCKHVQINLLKVSPFSGNADPAKRTVFPWLLSLAAWSRG